MAATAGFDIAKEFHWLHVADERGRKLSSRRVDNDPAEIRAAVDELLAVQAEHGTVTVGLDILGSMAGLLTAMLLAAGLRCVHTPGLAVNRARTGTRGGANKSDPRDAAVIAELVARRDDLREVRLAADADAELRLLVGHRTHLVKDHSASIARLRDLLLAVHPSLERVVDPTNISGLILLTGYVTPSEIRSAGAARITGWLHRRGVKHPTAAQLAEAAHDAAVTQRIAVPAEARIASLIKEMAIELLHARDRLKTVETEIAALVAAHPDAAVIASLPGMGPALTAEFLAIVGDISRFDSGDALAAASGLTPKLTQSGKVRYSHSATGGDKALKRVFYQSAFCAIRRDPASRTFYDRKRAEGKRHHQALIALARRRVNVLFAMIRDHEPYQARPKLRLLA